MCCSCCGCCGALAVIVEGNLMKYRYGQRNLGERGILNTYNVLFIYTEMYRSCVSYVNVSQTNLVSSTSKP